MYLKTLYISGFKSFAYPIKIEFNKAVNAIVGPNGSGKSNISDALRFVIGEQRTKQMRSQNMHDILFSGTESEPARGVAEVRLTLGREPEPDLVITRKYYRSGDSEYLLNGKRVRLKDIYNVFLDTGLGKNGYSIVSQGGVENIIGANPNEIRELVEEAIGISSYKVKKNETERSLKKTDQNLERSKDLLDEIKKQLKPLEKQANKTRQYLELSNQIRVIDLVSFYNEYLSFSEELNDLDLKLVDSNFLIFDLSKKSEKKDRLYVESRNKTIKLEEELVTLEDSLTELKEEEINLTKEIALEKNSIILNEANINRIIKELKESKQIQKKSEAELGILKKNYRKIYYKLKKAKNESKTIYNELNGLDSRLNELKVTDFNSLKNDLIQEINHLKIEINHLKIKISSNTESNIYFDKEIEHSRDELVKLQEDYREKQNILEGFNSDLNILTKRINKIVIEYNQINKDISQSNSKIDRLTDQLKFAENIKKSYSNFNPAVKAIMDLKRKNDLKQIFGPVSDLFTVDKKYQIAIQVALGNRAQNIIVADTEITKKLINYLKNTKKGRATFLPLNNIKSNYSINTAQFKDFPGFIDLASNLIRTEEKFNKIFNSLLGNTLVFTSYDSARDFRKRYPKFNLITLDGESFYASGAIVGGSLKTSQSSVFNNKNEINSLKEEIKKLGVNKLSLEKKAKELKESQNSLLQQKLSLEENIKIINQKIIRLEESSNQIKKNIITLQNRQSKNCVEELDKELLNKNLKLKNLEEKLEDLDQTTLNNQEEIESLQNKLFNCHEKLTEARVEENTLNKEFLFLKEKINSLLLVLKNQIQSIETLEIQKKELIVSTTQIKTTIREKENTLIDTKDSIKTVNNDLDKKRELIKQERHSMQSLEDEIKEISKVSIAEMENKNKLERSKERIEYKLNNLKETIFEKYQVTFLMVQEEINDLKRQNNIFKDLDIVQLRANLRALGNINPNAIEDHTILKKRYDRINSQYKDLLKAKDDIIKTIDSLNEIIENRFKEQFKKLNSNFSKAFTTLFEGGKANLSFTDPNDILSSGITLNAQPPGKNLKSINLLSGGEKAMTAIALLFSFIQLNPTPFILIDEIDAALDDSNIVRFARYINLVKENNQFIIITHRKSTLNFCETIHGITMASDGVSRLCSLEVSDYI